MLLVKKGLTVMILALVVLLMSSLLLPEQKSPVSAGSDSTGKRELMAPGERFIRSHMLNADGTLRTYLKPTGSIDPELALGHEALSESMGLWLLYAVEKGDRELFKMNADVVKQNFMKKDGWIYWKVGKLSDPPATNALIDDLRIAYALNLASDKWNESGYRATADTIVASLLNRQVSNNAFVDFYDYEKKWSSNVITISYLDMFAIVDLYEHSRISEELYRQTESFLKELPMKNGFYPFSYHVTEFTYDYQEEINLLDQLFIEYSRAKLGYSSSEFWAFLKNSFYEDNVLYGRYDSTTKRKAVEYEAPAVYGLAILCAIALNEPEFAEDVYYRMLRFQSKNPDSDYYGGYMNYSQMDTHIFDNLLALLAERKLINARIIQ